MWKVKANGTIIINATQKFDQSNLQGHDILPRRIELEVPAIEKNNNTNLFCEAVFAKGSVPVKAHTVVMVYGKLIMSV